ncbi:Dam family site-specific DNA-(adenine-N6)-methyltransferase [bacterium]|nr:Dam family site-specific DNA-(adenine-N6)-methyltransferase [bacterium]MBU1985523.1 Dam family site-specific DNA-(adenine-N6)-methyltransferase [bacterium]
MNSLPFDIDHVGVPPIKCQGIKTKLVPFIFQNIRWHSNGQGRWIEPFLGSGVVVFNLAPDRAILGDTNTHIINLYRAISAGTITAEKLRCHLQKEGDLLRKDGEKHYYRLRDRFNSEASPYDFVFLNRSCFNGVMRFNGNGRFNVPFCRKPERFSSQYITKIVNQVGWLARQMRGKKWDFRHGTWESTLESASLQDFVYLDPPYIGRHTDYYNNWSQSDANRLAVIAQRLSCGFALSMWFENRYRKNTHIEEMWSGNIIRLFRHFYHVGSLESLRNEMHEALVIRSGYEALEQVSTTAHKHGCQIDLYQLK